MEKENKQLDNSLKLIAKSSFIVLITIIFSKILTYGYRILIARSLGPETYGLFTLGLMMLGWFTAIFGLGLPSGIVRFISIYRGKNEIEKIKYIVQKTKVILVFSGIIAGIILFLISKYVAINIFHNPDLTIFLRGFSLMIPILLLASVFLTTLQAYEKVTIYSLIRNVLDNALKLLMLWILILFGFKQSSIIFSYFLGVIGMLLVSYYFVKKLLPKVLEKPELEDKTKKSINSEIFSYSWPLIFLGIVTSLFTWADSFVLGYFNGVTDVGIYNAAVPIALLFGIAPALFVQLFFPLITKEFARKNIKMIEEMSKQVVKWIFIINLPFMILITLFPGSFINLFFGADYIAAEVALRYLGIGFFFYSLFIVSENLISMAGNSKKVLFNIILAASFNIILNIILVPKYGLKGAAISTMISYIFLGLLTLIQAYREVSIIPLRRKLLLISLVSLIPTAILIVLKQFISLTFLTLFLQGLLFIILYSFLIIITGCFDKNDIMILRSVKNKLTGIKNKRKNI